MPGVEVELACGAADAPKEAPRFGRGHPKLSKYCYGDCQAERPKELFTQNEWDKCASKLRRCITCVAAKAKKVPDQSAAAAQQPPQQQPPQQARTCGTEPDPALAALPLPPASATSPHDRRRTLAGDAERSAGTARCRAEQ
eukprot:6090785-Prymnesium_polylepis.1